MKKLIATYTRINGIEKKKLQIDLLDNEPTEEEKRYFEEMTLENIEPPEEAKD